MASLSFGVFQPLITVGNVCPHLTLFGVCRMAISTSLGLELLQHVLRREIFYHRYSHNVLEPQRFSCVLEASSSRFSCNAPSVLCVGDELLGDE